MEKLAQTTHATALPLPEKVNNFWYVYNDADTVIIFVHGIFSSSRECWLYRDPQDPEHSVYWPDLVRMDSRLESPSIYLGGFTTSLNAGDLSIKDCARELLDALTMVDSQGRRPPLEKPNLIFVCHSAGGIVVRYLLDRHRTRFKEKAIGLVLIASPSLGSVYANKLATLAQFYNQRLGLQLQWGGESLRDLDDRFKDLVFYRQLPRLTGVEAYEHYFILRKQWLPSWVERWVPNRRKLVSELSAGRYFDAPRLLPNTDHFSAVKPESFDHPAHVLLVTFWLELEKPDSNTKFHSFTIVETFDQVIKLSIGSKVLFVADIAEVGEGEANGREDFEKNIFPQLVSITRCRSVLVCWGNCGTRFFRKKSLADGFKAKGLLFRGVFLIKEREVIRYEKIGLFAQLKHQSLAAAYVEAAKRILDPRHAAA
jgi:pimeloyl-ACP methyl ester carboxylesterase